MSSRSLAGRISTVLAASALLLIGLAGVVKPRRAIGLDGASTLGSSTESASLTRHLRERELTLDQRRDVEVLLKEFTLAQMTRHYWGSFSDSLLALGLTSPSQAEVSVQSDARSTTLWVVPRRGREAYLAMVEIRDNRLSARHCRGPRERAMTSFPGECPQTWFRLEMSSGGADS